METDAVVAETGARARAATTGGVGTPAARAAGTEEVGRLPREQVDSLVSERLAAHRAAIVWRSAAIHEQAGVRVGAVVVWPVGRRCPLGRLREAWVAHRYGLAKVVDCGTALAGPVGSGLAARTGRAVALYEAHADHRPAGWPASGAGALCALAAQGRAVVFAGDVARLLALAKGMRAIRAGRRRDAAASGP